MPNYLKTFLALIVLSGATVGIELASARIASNLATTNIYDEKIVNGKYVAMSGPDVDIVILGDSTGINGIVPSELQRITGLSSGHFGTYGSMSFVSDIHMLKTYLAHHPKPTHVIVMKSIITWLPSEFYYTREHLSYLDTSIPLLQSNSLRTEQKVSLLTASLLPSLQNKYRLWRNFNASSLDGLLEKKGPPEPQNGYVPLDNRLDQKEIAKMHQELLAELDMHGARMPSQENLVLIKELCRIGDAYDVPIDIISGVYVLGTDEIAEIKLLLTDINTLVSEAIADSSHCTWHPPEAFHPDYMDDLFHPNMYGTIPYAHRVARLLGYEKN
jgi:hypothetical protein